MDVPIKDQTLIHSTNLEALNMTQMGKEVVRSASKIVTGSAWKQWLFSIIAYLPFFTRTVQTTYISSITTTAVPKIDNGVLWTTTALVLGAIASTPVSCWTADRFGRKVVVLAIGILQVLPIVLLYVDQCPAILIASCAIIGVSSSAIFTVLPVYVKETCQIRSRGVALALMMLLSSLGDLMTSGLLMTTEDSGSFVMYVMTALVVVQLLLMIWLPETPSYFVMKDNLERANECLSKLKCLDVNSTSVLKEIDVLKAESYRARSSGKLNLFQILKSQLWRDTSRIGLLLVTCYTLGGSLVYLDHWKVLRITNISVEVETTNIVVPSVIVIGSLLSLVVISVCEQRYLLTVSFAIMAIGLGVLGVFMQSSSTSVPWFPITALLLTIFGWSLAWALPFVVLIESLNLEVRTTLMGVVYCYSQILYLVHVHTFKDIEDFVGIHALCYIFAGINIYGCVYALFVVPDTRRKTVRSIEKQLKRIPPWEM